MRHKWIAKIIIVIFLWLIFFISQISIVHGYSDINGHWASDTIKKWVDQEVVKGYEDGTFKPDNYITRAEFVVLLNRLIKSNSYNEIYYKDVRKNSWFYVDMAKAVTMGYLKGYDDNTIRPNDFITREEVATVLYNTSFNNNKNPNINVLNRFYDYKEISLWSKKPLASAVLNGFITGYNDNTIKPSNNITRAETIIILDRIFGDIMNTFKIIAYYAYWTDKTVDEIDYDGLTHINYAFAVPNMDGTVDVENPKRLEQLVTEAHLNGVKVYIAVGGWGYDREFNTITSDRLLTQTFISNIIQIVKDYNLDGVDMDWEYPDVGDEPLNFINLMSELRKALDTEQNKGLTAAITAGVTPMGWPTNTGIGINDEIINIVDWLNLMVYDGHDGVYVLNHSPFIFAVNSIDYWVNVRGFPGDKLVLGVPFYGHTPDWMTKTYKDIVSEDPVAPYKDYSNGYFYNGIETIRSKTRLALDEVGGIMIWELSQDATNPDISLLEAIIDEVNKTK